jgi:hypothetical protein
MSRARERIRRLEHSRSKGGTTVIFSACPLLPDDPSERHSYITSAIAEGRATRRRMPGGFCVYVHSHARPLTSEEWVALYAPKAVA